jgi:hypothetical protein
MSCDDEGPVGASATPPQDPDCQFRTVTRYFEGPVTARCVTCGRFVGLDEVGDHLVSMPCGVTWSMNARSILNAGQ